MSDKTETNGKLFKCVNCGFECTIIDSQNLDVGIAECQNCNTKGLREVKMGFADVFRRVIAIIDPYPNSKITQENKGIKVLADWGRKACDEFDQRHGDKELLEASVMELAKRMQYKLEKNKHKECPVMNPNGLGRGWNHCKIEWLLGRLREETIELEDAIDNNEGHEAIMMECADVANFAMMIHDNTLAKYKEKT